MKNKETINKSIAAFSRLETNPIDFMRNTKFKRSELGLDARIANHWLEKGLFSSNQVNGAWLYFNLSEAFWVRIIMKMRDFNVSLEIIKKIKDAFFSDLTKNYSYEEKEIFLKRIKNSELIDKNHLKKCSDEEILECIFKSELTFFEKVLIDIIVRRPPYFIIISQFDEPLLIDMHLLTNSDNQENLDYYQILTQKSHVRISLNEILGDLVTCFGELICYEKIPILTKKEAEIIRLLRTENTSKIEIRFKNNSEAEIVEITTQNLISEKVRLNDVIVSRGYQNITIKTQNGQIVFCENTTKYKLDTE